MSDPKNQPIDEADKVGDDPTLQQVAQARINKLLKKPTGTLKQWEIATIGGTKVAFGFCTEHEVRKDLIGRRVTTSAITVDASDDGYIETMNTIYKLVDRATE